MREIKFRAWHKPNNYDTTEPTTTPRMIYFDAMDYCDEYNHLGFGLAKDSRNPDGGDYGNLGASQEEFIEVMQFTGLRDKNGREIYEGDLLRYRRVGGDIEIAPVTYRDYASFGMENMDFGACSSDDGWEVVGNIWETPSLRTQRKGDA